MRYVLGIESSCDETAAAIVREDGKILSHVITSQFNAHSPYGGVVPEIAAREHIQAAHRVITQAITQSGLSIKQLSAVAATTGPGLIGAVMVGATIGKAVAMACSIPFISINHLEAHALVVRQEQQVSFPYLLLLVSGGHCQIILARGLGNYQVLGRTRDDALGEAFDKCSKMLGLGMPGGPAIERAAQQGNPHAHAFARPMFGTAHADFSFSGLKTAVRMHIEAISKVTGSLPPQAVADICASFQQAAFDAVVDRLRVSLTLCDAVPEHLVIAGGVAANLVLRHKLEHFCNQNAITLAVASPNLCTDNGVMIAWAGMERLIAGDISALSCDIKARWPLESLEPLAV